MKGIAINKLTEQFEPLKKFTNITSKILQVNIPLANSSANQNSPSINNYCNSTALKTNKKAIASMHRSGYISFCIVSLNVQIRAF